MAFPGWNHQFPRLFVRSVEEKMVDSQPGARSYFAGNDSGVSVAFDLRRRNNYSHRAKGAKRLAD